MHDDAELSERGAVFDLFVDEGIVQVIVTSQLWQTLVTDLAIQALA